MHLILMQTSTTRLFTALFGLLLLAGPAHAQEVTVTADISANTTWTAGNTYLLNGLIFVNEGATLTIEPGTVIKGLLQGNITSGDGASALIVRRGAQFQANGTAGAPIIFTSELDDVDDPFDLTQRDRGLWGGVILLGRASINQPDTQIEGIPESEDATFGGGAAGQGNDDDSSGSLQFVSIRHGGFSISGVEGDEINGLTMGAVGRGTTIEHIEVFANNDDGYEWFGGTAEVKYLVAAFCADDSFDYDQGFRGKGQYLFSVQDTDITGRCVEGDGGDAAGDDAEPASIPIFSNMTCIGSGVGATVPDGDQNDRTFAIRDAGGGKFYNSVYTDFANVAINIEDLDSGTDSRSRFEAGDLLWDNNIFFGYGAGSDFASLVSGFAAAGVAGENTLANPQLGPVCRAQTRCLDPRPALAGPAATGADFTAPPLATNLTFFDAVTFRGAFDPVGSVWATGWSALDTGSFLGGLATPNEDAASASTFGLRSVYPNPVAGTATVTFELARAQPVTLAVYDLLGREVAVLADGPQAEGVLTATFDAAGLPSGVYFVRLSTETAREVRKVVVVR